MMLPGRPWVFELIELKDMPAHILRHSLMVRKVAVTLAAFVAVKRPIDIDLVDRAALLHDICKADAIQSG
ncbi:MAG TPA: HDIG domain-containing protein, partial [Deltaproteobacteria bacterium]|nr:HDIG domain-containing protein [Deltaproteobacteria bacterium]